MLAIENEVMAGIDLTKAAEQFLQRIKALEAELRIDRNARQGEASIEFGRTTGSRATMGTLQTVFDNTVADVNQPGIDAFENFQAPETGVRGVVSPMMNSDLTRLKNMRDRLKYMQTETLFGFGGVSDEDRGKLERAEAQFNNEIRQMEEELKTQTRGQEDTNELLKQTVDVLQRVLNATTPIGTLVDGVMMGATARSPAPSQPLRSPAQGV